MRICEPPPRLPREVSCTRSRVGGANESARANASYRVPAFAGITIFFLSGYRASAATARATRVIS